MLSTQRGNQLPKSSKLVKSSCTVGSMTMASRVSGLVRDVVVANYFGSSAAADAFFVAFKIPNFLRRLFAEGAFSQAFIPVLSEYKINRNFDEVRLLVSRVCGTLAGSLMMVVVLCMLTSPLLIRLFAPGFSDDVEKMALAEEMLLITFPYLFLISMTAFFASVLNCYNYFAVPAFTPTLLNVSMISATIFLSPWFEQPVFALAWGVVIAGFSQMLLQLPFLWQLRLLPKPSWNVKDQGVMRIGKLMIPALFSVSVSQINLLLDTVLASFLETGSVSWLYYSDRLTELPLGVFGIAIATVILPNLSQQHANASKEQFSNTLDWAMRCVFLIGVPAMVALIILAEPLLITLFHYGNMQDRDVVMAAMSLQAYALGIVPFMLIKILAPGFFAQQDTKTPVRIAIIAMVTNMVFNLILVFWLQHVGLALATSLSASINALLLFLGLLKKEVYSLGGFWRRFLFKIIFSNICMAVLLWGMREEVENWLQATLLERILHMGALVGAGMISYFLILYILGVRPRDFKY